MSQQAPVMSSYSTSLHVQGQGQAAPGNNTTHDRPEFRKDTMVYSVNSVPPTASVIPNGASTAVSAVNLAQRGHEVCACLPLLRR